MRVLIVADAAFARFERAMLERLAVGLADEGVRVVYAAPSSVLAKVDSDLFSRRIGYTNPRHISLSKLRGQKLARVALAQCEPSDSSGIDLVHAFGNRAWRIALAAGEFLDAPVALEVACKADVTTISRLPRHAMPDVVVASAPDGAVEQALRARGISMPIRTARWGVHALSDPRPILQDERAVSVCLGGRGSDIDACAELGRALSDVLKSGEEIMVFADAEVAHSARIWHHFRERKLLDHLSLVPDMEARRELLLQADILLVPEALGEHRTLILDAMGAGMVVIARDDPFIENLRDGETARVLRQGDAQRWEESLSALLRNRADARRIAESGRQYIRATRKASSQVAAVLDSYEWMVGDDAIPFDASKRVR